MVRWSRNDRLFVSELERGHHHAQAVARRLCNEGLRATVPPMEARARIADARRWTKGDIDLTVQLHERTVVLETKSRRLWFTGPHDWPRSHDPAMVDTVDGFESKEHLPVAVVLVSQPTGGCAVVPLSSRPSWRTIRATDRARNIVTVSYACPAMLLTPFGDLVAWLKERT